jgi:hypothetical protein
MATENEEDKAPGFNLWSRSFWRNPFGADILRPITISMHRVLSISHFVPITYILMLLHQPDPLLRDKTSKKFWKFLMLGHNISEIDCITFLKREKKSLPKCCSTEINSFESSWHQLDIPCTMVFNLFGSHTSGYNFCYTLYPQICCTIKLFTVYNLHVKN